MSDPSPFAGTTQVASLTAAAGAVTLLEGQTFCRSDRAGDISTDFPHGLFVLDTRVLSRWELRINGHCLEPLAVEHTDPFTATFVARSAPVAGHADADLIVFRRRHVGRGMRETVTVTNHGTTSTPVLIEAFCDADFADLFEVKERRVVHRGRHSQEIDPATVRFGHSDGTTKHVTITFSGAATVEPGLAAWRTILEPSASWEVCVEFVVELDGRRIEPRFRCGGDDAAAVPAVRLGDWRARIPTVESDHPAFDAAVRRSSVDLASLRIFDPDHPDLPVLAAGAPWFMTVFGRDSLLTAWMTLIADPSLARGVLETLARFQGAKTDPTTEEEPGKILHEMRFGTSTTLALGGGDIYYGTIDATPLFVMLLGELRRWNPDDTIVDRLLPHADRALEWIENFGDRDRDGYVEYQRHNPDGLANQGWKDSWDAIRFADGRPAEPPIALCEVQGYTYAAYVARAHFAREAGDDATYRRWAAKAHDLRERFNRDFWLDDIGTYALGLDRDKQPIDAVASNVGHCLWTGIIDADRAGSVADRLLADDMFTGYGIRTLASSMAAYNPVSYHNGSVWPHDNAICAAGLARYGYTDHAHRIIAAQLDVAVANHGSLPELFAGFDRSELGTPAAYPTSCNPQAWAAAAPLLWLRTMLRLDPWIDRQQIWLAPASIPGLDRIHVNGIRIGDHALDITVVDGEADVRGVDGLRVVTRPRPPLSSTLDADA